MTERYLWNSSLCDKKAVYYCVDHKDLTCNSCMAKDHLKCKVEGIKTKSDVRDLVKYCKKLVKRIKGILETEMAQLALEKESKDLKPYFFEFKILFRLFSKDSKNSKKTPNWTQVYFSFKKLLDKMKKEPSYTKVIMYEFEQSIKMDFGEANSPTSKQTGNCFSNIVWKMGDECFSISEGIDESLITSEHTHEHETECSEQDYREPFGAKKSKFEPDASPSSPEIRMKEKCIEKDNFHNRLSKIGPYLATKITNLKRQSDLQEKL